MQEPPTLPCRITLLPEMHPNLAIFSREILLGLNQSIIQIRLGHGKIRTELTGLLQDIDKLFDMVERSLGEFGKKEELQQIKDSAKQHIKEIMKAI